MNKKKLFSALLIVTQLVVGLTAVKAQVDSIKTIRIDGKQHTEKFPQFSIGGDKGLYKFLGENMKYPKEAMENDAQGRVVVYFVIEADGSVTNVKVEEGVKQQREKIVTINKITGRKKITEGELIPQKYYDLIDEEAVRVVKSMPNWIPGEQDGVKVRVEYRVPINFRLD